MFLMHDADHLRSLDLKGCTCGDRSGGRETKPDRTCNGFLSDEISGREKRDRSFFASFRNHGDFCAALLQIEN